MATLRAGIIAAASGAQNNLAQYEDDWTATSLPSGWAVSGAGTAVYAAGGTYNSDDSATTQNLTITKAITSRSYNTLTIMMAVDVAVQSDHRFTLDVGDAQLLFGYESTGPSSLYETYITGNGYTHTPVSTGVLILAATLAGDGTLTSYLLEIGEVTNVQSGTDGPNPSPNESGITGISITLLPWDPVADVLGTAGNFKVQYTYFGFDEVLTQGQIETKAGTWGWS